MPKESPGLLNKAAELAARIKAGAGRGGAPDHDTGDRAARERRRAELFPDYEPGDENGLGVFNFDKQDKE